MREQSIVPPGSPGAFLLSVFFSSEAVSSSRELPGAPRAAAATVASTVSGQAGQRFQVGST
jgi:hypothetical protein